MRSLSNLFSADSCFPSGFGSTVQTVELWADLRRISLDKEAWTRIKDLLFLIWRRNKTHFEHRIKTFAGNMTVETFPLRLASFSGRWSNKMLTLCHSLFLMRMIWNVSQFSQQFSFSYFEFISQFHKLTLSIHYY